MRVKCQKDGKLPFGRKTLGVCGADFAFRCHKKRYLFYVAFYSTFLIVLYPLGHKNEAFFVFACKLCKIKGALEKLKEVVPMMHNKLRDILLLGLFVALEVILTRFLSVENLIVRISFQFLPIAISAILFGPVMAGIGAAVADVLGMMIFPKGAYFPGFTFSSFVSGYLYGVFLYKKKITLLRTFSAALTVIVVCSLVLNTIWLIILTQKGAYAIVSARLVTNAVFLPVQTIMIYYVWKYAGSMFTRSLTNQT